MTSSIVSMIQDISALPGTQEYSRILKNEIASKIVNSGAFWACLGYIIDVSAYGKVN